MNKRNIIIASLIGVIALSTVSITLAWYANSDVLRVDNIEVKIDGDRELLISTSTEEESFKNEIKYEELEDVPATYIPTSSMYSSKWMDVKADKPTFYDSSNSLIGADGVPYLRDSRFGFLSQEIYLMCDDDVYVTLDALDTYIKPNISFINAHAQELQETFPDLTLEEIKEKSVQLANAMRFSILIPDVDNYQYVVIDPNHNEDEVYFGGILDNSINRYYDSYFNTSDSKMYEVMYGEISNREKAIYEEELQEDSPLLGEPSAFNASHQKGVKRFNRDASIANGMEIAKENALTLDDFNKDVPEFYFPLKQYEPYKLVVSIYIEGWDLDSINSTMGANFLANLSFKIYREM